MDGPGLAVRWWSVLWWQRAWFCIWLGWCWMHQPLLDEGWASGPTALLQLQKPVSKFTCAIFSQETDPVAVYHTNGPASFFFISNWNSAVTFPVSCVKKLLRFFHLLFGITVKSIFVVCLMLGVNPQASSTCSVSADCVLTALLSPSPVFACLGFLSPANRGALMTCAVVVWVLLGTPAGYVASRLYKCKSSQEY